MTNETIRNLMTNEPTTGAQRLRGVVVTFMADRRFGFLRSEHDVAANVRSRDVFFHESQVDGLVFEGSGVTYEIGESRGRSCAVRVRKVPS